MRGHSSSEGSSVDENRQRLTGGGLRQTRVQSIRAQAYRRWFRPGDWPIFVRILVGMVLLLVVALSASTLMSVLTAQSEVRTKVGESLQGLAQTQAVSLGNVLDGHVTLLRNVALIAQLRLEVWMSNTRYAGTPQEIQAQLLALDEQWRTAADDSTLVESILDPLVNRVTQQLLEYTRAFPEHVEMFITDRYGGLVAATNRTSDYYQADEEWWQAAYNDGQGALYISQPEFDESSGYTALLMSVPVLSSGGEIVGILRTTVRIDELIETVSQVRVGQTGYVKLVNSEGVVIADPVPERIGQVVSPSWRALAAAQEGAGRADLVDEEGERVLVGYAALADRGMEDEQKAAAVRQLGWTAFTVQSRREALATAGAAARTSVLVASGFVLVAAALSFALARTVAQPLSELVTVARRMTEGDLRVRVPFKRQDEVGQLAVAFEDMAGRVLETVNTLEQRVTERTRNLEATGRVSGVLASVLDPAELERQAVELVRENFDLYYVGLFMVDQTGEWTRDLESHAEPNRWAVLRAGTGEPGRLMVDRKHRFEVGDPNSMIGRCVGEGQAIIALDVGREARRFSNPLLPLTRSEMALPLLARGRVLGAMTIQSDRPQAFSPSDIATMQTMADQIAGAISNAQSFATAQAALDRSEQIIRRYVRESWERLGEVTEVTGYLYTPDRSGPDEQAWLPTMGQAVQSRDLVVSEAGPDRGGGASVAAPLLSRGEVIGALGLRRASGEPWTEEQIDLVRDVTLQIAQAIETRRLFEETQRTARREAVLRQTTEKVRAQADMDALLRAAVQEIQRAVGASHVAIRLGTETQLASTRRPSDGGGVQDGS